MKEIKAAVLIFLLICGLWDLRKREIPLWICMAGAVVILGLQIYGNEAEIWNMAAGTVIGLLLFVAGRVTGQIGAGDGIVFMVTGLGIGFWSNFLLLWKSLLFMAAVSLMLIFFRKTDWKVRLPFLPFVLCAYVAEFVKNME